MSTQPRLRRIIAGLGGLALVFGGLALSSSAANAALPDGNPPPAEAGEGATGNLTIHKYAGSTTDQVNNGTQQTINRPPLGGITFTAAEVGKMVEGSCVALDLTTAAGWTDAQAAIAVKPPALPYCLTGVTHSGTTDASGTLPLTGLDLGLYWVTEAPAPGVTPESSVPFYVSIPYPSASTTGGETPVTTTTWLYDVHVYPKNTLEGDGSKVVGDPATNGLGSSVPWTVQTRPLGSFNDGAPLVSYGIIDNLDSRLTYVPTATLQYKTPTGALTPVDSQYYTLTPPAAGGGGTLRADFTTTPADEESQSGVAWVNSLPAGTYFVLSFNTTVTGVGDIVNPAYENVDGEDTKIGEASTQWGPVKLLKHQTGNENKGLEGAVFEVYNSTSGACATLGSKVSVNGVDEFPSSETGIVNIAGLYVGHDGAPATRTYCVVEKTPPAGYAANTTPIPVVVKAESEASVLYKVPNAPLPGPNLPLTGSTGTMAFGLVGLGLIAAAGSILVVRRVRAKHTAER